MPCLSLYHSLLLCFWSFLVFLVLKRGISQLIPDSRTSCTRTVSRSATRETIFLSYKFFKVNVFFLTIHNALPCLLVPELSWTQNRCPIRPRSKPCRIRYSHVKKRQQPEAHVSMVPNVHLRLTLSLSPQTYLKHQYSQDHFCLPWGRLGTVPSTCYFNQFSSSCICLFACFPLEGQTLDSRLGTAIPEKTN